MASYWILNMTGRRLSKIFMVLCGTIRYLDECLEELEQSDIYLALPLWFEWGGRQDVIINIDKIIYRQWSSKLLIRPEKIHEAIYLPHERSFVSPTPLGTWTLDLEFESVFWSHLSAGMLAGINIVCLWIYLSIFPSDDFYYLLHVTSVHAVIFV